MIRRSVSIWVSPGPRMPIPPRCRSRWVHSRVSRGNRYWYCASSTWRLALAVCARLAKISRMRLVRSSIFTCNSRSIFSTCFDDKSSSKMTMPISFSSMYAFISDSFPDPTKVRELGVSSRCRNFFTGNAPAVSAKKASSLRYSFAFASFWVLVINPTKTVRSVSSWVKINSFILYVYKDVLQK